MKNKLRMGGNPIEDAKEAKERYQMVVKPVLEPQGFKKEGTSTNMYNKLLDTFLIVGVSTLSLFNNSTDLYPSLSFGSLYFIKMNG